MLSSLTLCVAGPDALNAVRDIHDGMDVARLEVCSRAEKALLNLGRSELVLLLIEPSGDTLSVAECELIRAASDFPVKVGLLVASPQTVSLAGDLHGLPTFAMPGDLFRLRQFVMEAHARRFRGPDDEGEVLSADTPTPFLGSEWAELMQQIQRIARRDSTVLLTGETGCGKTMLARRLHEKSPRANRPFVVADCAAMSETHVASDLFGHVRGSFTGADRERVGKLAEVGGGTLVLDEVNSLPLSLQAKLLRAVEERVFEPLGSNTVQRFDGRIVAASNADLGEAVRDGRFRADLYFRLNVVEFRIPPLRERVGAIIPLAQQFVRESRVAAMHGVSSITPAAMQKLLRYPWPGNVRELRNAIERAATFTSTAAIDVDDLPVPIAGTEYVPRATQPVRHDSPLAPTHPPEPASERERIEEVLQLSKNNRLAAAKVLGISRNSLYKKMHRLGMFLPKRPTTAGRFAVQPAAV